ncbi:T3SS (YopN, CesT) and YbjN peptide-binding chaperone 1 [Gloeomargarita sp.]
MLFESAPQQACYEKIRPWMQELFGDKVQIREDLPIFIIPRGSAYAAVEVLPWTEDDAIVCTWSYVVKGAELKPELLQYLLRKNTEIPFGAFGIDEDGDILLEHAIVGSTCDRKELETSAKSIMEMADRYDDEISALAGGQRAADRLGVQA